MEEEREERMTLEEMQRYIDQAMGEGRTYEESLVRLAWILGLHPAGEEWSEDGRTPNGYHC